MPIKYIKQIINQDFVYPNNEVSEYDQEIVHDLNENSVSGTVVTLTATTATSTGMTFTISTTWSAPSAMANFLRELYLRNGGQINLPYHGEGAKMGVEEGNVAPGLFPEGV